MRASPVCAGQHPVPCAAPVTLYWEALKGQRSSRCVVLSVAPAAGEAEAGGSQVRVHPGQRSQALSQYENCDKGLGHSSARPGFRPQCCRTNKWQMRGRRSWQNETLRKNPRWAQQEHTHAAACSFHTHSASPCIPWTLTSGVSLPPTMLSPSPERPLEISMIISWPGMMGHVAGSTDRGAWGSPGEGRGTGHAEQE